jgi:hypothetical protein
LWPPQRGVGLREPNLGKTNRRVSLHYSLAICFAPSLADLITFLTLTRLVVVIIFENFSFALFTPPLGDFQSRCRKGARSLHERSEPPRSPPIARCTIVFRRRSWLATIATPLTVTTSPLSPPNPWFGIAPIPRCVGPRLCRDWGARRRALPWWWVLSHHRSAVQCWGEYPCVVRWELGGVD